LKDLIFTLFLLVICVAGYEVNAQCSLPSQIPIVDKDTSIVSFLVEGANIDDLSLNGVCGFNINFTHDFIGDVSIILVSPSGQEVQLIGPSLLTSPNTQFIRWDIRFIPCAFSPNPDPGIAPVWYNINNWFQFTTYTGFYYPNLGCLEDFNTGPVNGSWSIKIIDAVDFGSGMIDDIGITFCDPTGIDCSSCVADAGSFDVTDLDFCEGQEGLRVNPQVSYSGSSPDTAQYVYKFAILNDGGSYLSDSIDLRGAAPGVYEVCGLSVSRSQEFSIPSILGLTAKEEYENALIDGLACAALTERCMRINIQDVRDTIRLAESICSGDAFRINGVDYTQEGTYIVGYNGPNCDSMTILDLVVHNLQGQIDGQQDLLTCTGNNVLLDGTGSSGDSTLSYRWFTLDGMIRSDTLQSSILVSQVGTYFLEVSSSFCIDTVSAQVMADNSFIELDFDFQEINCNNQSTLIDLTSSQPLSNVRWDGPAAFSRIGDDIVVSDPGTYLVTVTSVDGCTSIDSVLIVDGFDVEDPVFSVSDITCVQPVVNPGAILTDTSILSFSWSGPNGFSSSILNPDLSESGIYVLSITGDNGCTETWNLGVNDTRVFPQLTTATDTLDCQNPSILIEVNSSLSDVTYSWSGPNNFTSDIRMPQVTQDGNYTVTVTSIDQCVSTASLDVARDIRLPGLVLNDIVMNCSDGGNVLLDAGTDADNPSFIWSGPNNYFASGKQPSASFIGSYAVTVQGSNGCSRTDSLNIVPGVDIPNVTFHSDTINCDASVREIIPSDSLDYTFQYLSPTDVSFSETSPLTGEPGEYRIRVTDQVGCFADYIHRVTIDTIIPTITLNSLEIDCNNDSVMISLINDIPLRSTEWTGPGNFTSGTATPWVATPGYFTVVATGTNGCVIQDSLEVIENYEIPQITKRDLFFTCDKSEITLYVGVNMSPSTFVWSGPSSFSSTEDRPLVGVDGDYNVTVTGPNGCVNSDSVTIGYDTIAPIINLVNDGFLTCPDPIVTLSATSTESQISTSWIGPDSTYQGGLSLDVGTPGLWQLEAIDTAGCIGRAEVQVDTEIDYPDVVVNYNDMDCSLIFSNIEVTAGPLTENIFWSGPDNIGMDVTTYNTTIPGDYMILATGINGCDTMVNFTILKDTVPPDFILTVSDTIDCNSPLVTLGTVTNSIIDEFRWIGPNGFVSSDTTPVISDGGRYILQATGINGCTAIDTLQVTIDTLSPLVQGLSNDITCIASKAKLDVLTNIANPTYLWIGPNGFVSDDKDPLAVDTGSYIINITGPNGCTRSDRITLKADTDAPRIMLDSISYLLCDSSGANLEVSSDLLGTTFSWFGDGFFSSEQRPFVDAIGTYTVYATGPNGCRSFKNTVVEVDTRLPRFNSTSTNINCIDNRGMIIAQSVNDDLSWEWIGPNGFTSQETSVAVSDSGIYSLIVQGQNLCIDTQSVQVIIDQNPPVLNAGFDDILQCAVEEVQIDGSGSFGVHSISYQWTTQDGNILRGENTPLVTVGDEGSYTLTLRDNVNGCVSDTTISISRTPQEFEDFTAIVSDPSCVGFQNGMISFESQVGGYAPLRFSFEGGPFALKNDFQFLDAGTYTITARDSLGCEVTKTFTIDPPNEIFLDLGDDRSIELGESTDLIITSNISPDSIAQLLWSDTTALRCLDCLEQTITPNRTVVYNLKLIDLNGCMVEDEVLIRVPQEIDVKYPNVFRPSSSNGNNIFYLPQTRGINRVKFLSIYDRWGDRMFHAEDFLPGDDTIGWDGMFLGKAALPGVYVVLSEVILENGTSVLIESDVTLFR
jgi:hypothetical protein